MNNIHSSIDSPHPDLQVDEKANELAPYLPASNNGTLLYQGPVVGRWPNAEIAYSHAPGLSDEERHARAASFSTGIDGSGDVRFKLSPDPHISWWFCTHDWSVGGSWPVLVPPKGRHPDSQPTTGSEESCLSGSIAIRQAAAAG